MMELLGGKNQWNKTAGLWLGGKFGNEKLCFMKKDDPGSEEADGWR